MPFVYSTLTGDQRYAIYDIPPDGGIPQEKVSVVIKGGSNVATEKLVTPFGVRTEITHEQLQILENVPEFAKHKSRGFIIVRNDKVDPEVAVATNMKLRDDSAPYTPETMPRPVIKDEKFGDQQVKIKAAV